MKIKKSITMPLEQTARRLRFYVKAMQAWDYFTPLLSGERYIS
jgi:hypothetical protein